MSKPNVIVTVSGGLVQDVDIDGDVTVSVRDYDTDHDEPSAEDGVYADDDGNLYVETVYEMDGPNLNEADEPGEPRQQAQALDGWSRSVRAD